MKSVCKITLCALVAFTACTRDEPLGAGRDLLPEDAVQTWEVTLDGDRFLVADTAFGLYGRPADAPYIMLANDYDGVLTSRALIRFDFPRAIFVRAAGDSIRADSMPIWTSGSIMMLPDTAFPHDAGSLEVRRTTESWDRLTANWTYRVDSAGARVPWTVPGGSPGELISSATYTAATDTILLPIDSAMIAAWRDTTDAARGAVISMVTPGSRLRVPVPALHVTARSTLRPDTTVTLVLAPSRTFIYTPEQPDVFATPRVGGVQQWRTLLSLRPGIDTVTVPCASGQPGCRVRLGDVSINYASLLLQPQPTIPGFAPDRPVTVAVHGVLSNSSVPLQRSPLTESLGSTLTPIPVTSFTTPDAPRVEVPITPFFRLLADDDETFEDLPSHLALLQTGGVSFGFGTFSSAVRLRLILTTSAELQLP